MHDNSSLLVGLGIKSRDGVKLDNGSIGAIIHVPIGRVLWILECIVRVLNAGSYWSTRYVTLLVELWVGSRDSVHKAVGALTAKSKTRDWEL